MNTATGQIHILPMCTCTWLDRIESKLGFHEHGPKCAVPKELKRIEDERRSERHAEMRRLIAELEDLAKPNEHPVYRYRLLRARYLDRKRGAA